MSVRTDASQIVLTFDDGPDPVTTPRILDVLDEADATATFFVLLTRTRRYPEILSELTARGHEVALHGLDHRRLTGISPADVRQRLLRARSELEDATGLGVDWFRPPFGAQQPSTSFAIRRAGMTPVLWGPSLQDWKDTSREERARKAFSGARPGAIVLGHDGVAGPLDGHPGGHEPDLDRGAWLAEVLQEYRNRGLFGVALRKALATGSPVRRGTYVR